MTVNGRAIAPSATFDVVNPATGCVEAHAPECTAEVLDAAMEAAAAAQRHWRLDESARRAAMRQLADSVMQNADELSSLLQLETGKPTAVAAAEPPLCATWLEYYAAMDLPRETLQDNETALIELVHRPLGVVTAITPWNFPLALAMWKIAPALRAGNTVVLKPSPFAPLATLALGRIMGDVLPAGVVNTVSGGDDLGERMVAHRVPRMVSFTGSVAAGRNVAVSAMADLKRLTLELGGNDAAIVLDDADAEGVAASILEMAFFNTGQACVLPKRIFVPSGRYSEFVEAFAAVSAKMTTGDPKASSTVLGPLSTRPQYERVIDLVADAITGGAQVAAGGAAIEGPGFFFQPTILAKVAEGTRIVDEEQFGPALPIMAYTTVAEAIDRANRSEYGLCGSVWSADRERASTVAEQLEVGTTYVNAHGTLLPTIPFGGVKSSGIGLENGWAGLVSFTEPQVVHSSHADVAAVMGA